MINNRREIHNKWMLSLTWAFEIYVSSKKTINGQITRCCFPTRYSRNAPQPLLYLQCVCVPSKRYLSYATPLSTNSNPACTYLAARLAVRSVGVRSLEG
eukprot:470367-Pyramimonas_sp.AAC.2